jgi:hypothetical protein
MSAVEKRFTGVTQHVGWILRSGCGGKWINVYIPLKLMCIITGNCAFTCGNRIRLCGWWGRG